MLVHPVTQRYAEYFQISCGIILLLLADAIDNFDDNMTEVCNEAIAFLNKPKNESNRNMFFSIPFTWRYLGKNQKFE